METMNVVQLQIGDIVSVIDRLDPARRIIGVVKYIEFDFDLNRNFLYIRANEESLNTIMDPRFEWSFHTMTFEGDPYIEKYELL